MATILIVDDNKKNLQVLGNILNELNYRVAIAVDGPSAIKLTAKILPDIIVLDIMMPEMDGFEVCQILKSTPETKEIPIIFLTAKIHTEDVVKGFQLGGADYITKPFKKEELLARIKTHLELVENRKKLLNINEWLEDQVNQRTIELMNSNIQLEKAKKELEKLDAAKSEFLKIISHEIRTPLNGMIGGLSILKELVDSEETLEFVDVLDQSVARLENFSYAALDISALKTKGVEKLKLEETDLLPLVNNAEKILREKLNAKNLTLIKKFTGDIRPVRVDAAFIQKAIKCILENAIYYSPEGEKIEIVTLFESAQVSFIIKDNGKGFNELILKKLIMLGSGDHIDGNPGLGLYLTNLIAVTHGGQLNYYNRESGGAEVIISIPV